MPPAWVHSRFVSPFSLAAIVLAGGGLILVATLLLKGEISARANAEPD